MGKSLLLPYVPQGRNHDTTNGITINTGHKVLSPTLPTFELKYTCKL